MFCVISDESCDYSMKISEHPVDTLSKTVKVYLGGLPAGGLHKPPPSRSPFPCAHRQEGTGAFWSLFCPLFAEK